MWNCPNGYECYKCKFKPLEDEPVPHKHAALIKAWADGAKIQYKLYPQDKWYDVYNPCWISGSEYRIKPEPDVVSYAHVRGDHAWRTPKIVSSSSNNWNDGKHEQYTNPVNTKFTFDGQTGALKSVEMI